LQTGSGGRRAVGADLGTDCRLRGHPADRACRSSTGWLAGFLAGWNDLRDSGHGWEPVLHDGFAGAKAGCGSGDLLDVSGGDDSAGKRHSAGKADEEAADGNGAGSGCGGAVECLKTGDKETGDEGTRG